MNLDITEEDCTLSYLTLAHIFGRCLEEFALSVGARIGYWQARLGHSCLLWGGGDAQHIRDSLVKELK